MPALPLRRGCFASKRLERGSLPPLWAALAALAISCSRAPKQIELPPLPDAGVRPRAQAPQRSCQAENTRFCEAGKFTQCTRDGEFLEAQVDDCGARGQTCDAALGCVDCAKGERRCRACDQGDASCVAGMPNTQAVQACDDATRRWVDAETCDVARAQICQNAHCIDACQAADQAKSYVGCEFFAVDLDNAAISDTLNASAQQYAVVVANPQPVSVEVSVRQNNAALGKPPQEQEVARVTVPPGDLEVIKLPPRNADGSSPEGLNDGTNTALTSNAYHLKARWPIIAYQFNPLENVHVFSNDASLLLPTSAWGTHYTVASWVQTIAHSDMPGASFDGTSSNDDLRAFLTIVGGSVATHVTVELGPAVIKVLGAGPIPAGKPGDRLSLDIGPYDVINLETDAFNADFTGSTVDADHPVSVFSGSEASDVPKYAALSERQCCADHLEEQLLPDNVLGADFVVAHQASRSAAVNRASADGRQLVAETAEPEWTRVISISDAPTQVVTSLPPPDATLTLPPHGELLLKATQDFQLRAERAVSVITLTPSQQVTGIPSQYPGGDPSMLVVPPSEQFRKDYVFLSPTTYAFNFVQVVAPLNAEVSLDGKLLSAAGCERRDVPPLAAGAARIGNADTGTQWQTWSCQLSFPSVPRDGGDSKLGPVGAGVHNIVADMPVGIVVSGFDRFVGYAYVGGLNLNVLN